MKIWTSQFVFFFEKLDKPYLSIESKYLPQDKQKYVPQDKQRLPGGQVKTCNTKFVMGVNNMNTGTTT